MDRTALRLGLACAALVIVACNNDDGRTITFPDSGMGGTDSGMVGTDSGTPRPDSGGGGGMCAVTIALGSVPALPSACLPRCSSATLDRYNACMDDMCAQTELENDTTPSTPFTVNGMAQMGGLDCSGCVNYQVLSCAMDACPTETNAYLSCNPMTDAMMCNPQIMALNACISASMPFATCFGARGGMCFGASSAFAPDFDRRAVPLQAPSVESIGAEVRDWFRATYVAR